MNKPMLKELIHAFDYTRLPEQKALLKSLSVPMHRSTICVPKHSEYFPTKRVSELSTSEWIEFSKRQYESTKEQ